jgi:diguanylate cyclase (GGDEF)-like protein
MAQLIIVEGPNRGKTYELHTVNTVGTASTNTILLSDRRASPVQAEIRLRKDYYEIVNLDSKKQLLVNGEVLKRSKLQHGDWITIGDTTMVFSEEAETMDRKGFEIRAISAEDLLKTSTIQTRRKHHEDADSVLKSLEIVPDRGVVSQRLATLYKVTNAISAILNLPKLLDKILDIIFEVLRADRAFIMLMDDEQQKLRPTASRLKSGLPDEGGLNISKTIIKEVFNAREAVLSMDAMDDERFMAQSIVDHQIRSVMCAPLVSKDKFLGIIQVDSLSTSRAFTADDLDLLTAIAMQSSTAIENSKAYKRRQEYSRSLVFLSKATQKLSSYLERDRIIRELVKCACSILGCTKSSVILCGDGEEERYVVPYAVGISKDLWAKIDKETVGGRFARWVIEHKEPLLVSNMKDLPSELYQRPNTRYKTKSFLIVPILSKASGIGEPAKCIGTLCVTDKLSGGSFSGNDQELLSILASQTGIALSNADLYEKATVDVLTRVYVRRYFFQKLEEEVKRALLKKQPLSLCMMDLDHFKGVNDNYGHQAGDRILQGFGQLLKRTIRGEYTVARYGGEEFSVIIPNTDVDIALKISERVRKAVEVHSFNTPEVPIRMTVSTGLAGVQPGDTKDSLIERADTALYAAKKEGRNRSVIWRPDMH